MGNILSLFVLSQGQLVGGVGDNWDNARTMQMMVDLASTLLMQSTPASKP